MQSLVYYLDKPGGIVCRTGRAGFRSGTGRGSVADRPHVGLPIRCGDLQARAAAHQTLAGHRAARGLVLRRCRRLRSREVSARRSGGPGVRHSVRQQATASIAANNGTGDWTSCPSTQATGHEFPGFARTHAILPDWFVKYGPIVKFAPWIRSQHRLPTGTAGLLPGRDDAGQPLHREPRRRTDRRGFAKHLCPAIRSGDAVPARSSCQPRPRTAESRAAGFRRRPRRRPAVGRRDRGSVMRECQPFNEPHFVMINAPCREAYELAPKLMGYGTVLDGHAGVKGGQRQAANRPRSRSEQRHPLSPAMLPGHARLQHAWHSTCAAVSLGGAIAEDRPDDQRRRKDFTTPSIRARHLPSGRAGQPESHCRVG